jgi:hypothetical protein
VRGITATTTAWPILYVLFPSCPGCGTPPLSYWLPGLAQSRPYSPLFRSRFLHWLTGSYISNQFHACGILIALTMEAARTSEKLVNFYQTTRRYNPEDSRLYTHRRENLKLNFPFLHDCYQGDPQHRSVNCTPPLLGSSFLVT